MFPHNRSDLSKQRVFTWEVIVYGSFRYIGCFDGFKLIGERFGPFDLALHPWYEPFVRLSKAAASHNVDLATPIMGEQVLLNQSRINQNWWAGSSQTAIQPSQQIGEAK